MIRAVFLRRVRGFIVVYFVWRKRIEYEIAASFSDEVSRIVTAGSAEAAKFMGKAQKILEDHRKFMGAWFLE